MQRAQLAVALVLLSSTFAAPAQAQGYESSFRFGFGLDYAGLAGRTGGLGGLRLQLGARVHEHAAVYWQGQLLGGAFNDSEGLTVGGVGWNAVLAEASYGIFQVAAGPSFDVTMLCGISGTAQDVAVSECAPRVGPGIAARAGVRFGIVTLSGDLHVTFDEQVDPTVWVLAGVGIQLGDVATEPMTFPSAEEEPPPAPAWEPPPLSPPPVRRPSGLGHALDEPTDPLAEDDVSTEPTVDVDVEVGADAEADYRAPTVQRFERDDVDTSSRTSAPRERRAREPRNPDLRDELDIVVDDDPIGGLEE